MTQESKLAVALWAVAIVVAQAQHRETRKALRDAAPKPRPSVREDVLDLVPVGRNTLRDLLESLGL